MFATPDSGAAFATPDARTEAMARDYARSFDAHGVSRIILEIWPCWDVTLGLILFIDDEPRLMSSCVMDVFGAENRHDVRRVPDLFETDWDYYGINEQTLPRVATSGRYTVVFLGEREEPYPFLPMDEQTLDAFPQGPATFEFFLASIEAAKNALSYLTMIHDDGSVLRRSDALPETLGLDADDTTWIPDEWRVPLVAGPIEVGHSAVEDNADVMFRWMRRRVGPFNAYWARLCPADSPNIDLRSDEGSSDPQRVGTKSEVAFHSGVTDSSE